MKIVLHFAIVALSLVAVSCGQDTRAQDLTPTCPRQVRVDQKVVGAGAEWLVFDAAEQHSFTNVSFSEGEPSNRVTLAPTKADKAKAVWNFDSSEEGFWMSCAYSGTSVVLSQRLSSQVRSCDVEYDTRFSQPVAVRVKCSS